MTECEPIVENIINIPTIIKTRTNGLYEEVSDLNGIAMPAIYFDSIYRNLNIDNLGQDNTNLGPGSGKLVEMINESVQRNDTE